MVLVYFSLYKGQIEVDHLAADQNRPYTFFLITRPLKWLHIFLPIWSARNRWPKIYKKSDNVIRTNSIHENYAVPNDKHSRYINFSPYIFIYGAIRNLQNIHRTWALVSLRCIISLIYFFPRKAIAEQTRPFTVRVNFNYDLITHIWRENISKSFSYFTC